MGVFSFEIEIGCLLLFKIELIIILEFLFSLNGFNFFIVLKDGCLFVVIDFILLISIFVIFFFLVVIFILIVYFLFLLILIFVYLICNVSRNIFFFNFNLRIFFIFYIIN